MSTNITNMPFIPLRGVTVFPYMFEHFDVGRNKSITAVENAMSNGQMIFLVTQKDHECEEPTIDDIYEIGTLCNVKQIIKLPKGGIRILVEGIKRAKLSKIIEGEEYFNAEVEDIEEESVDEDVDAKALAKILKSELKKLIVITNREKPDIYLNNKEPLNKVVDVASGYIEQDYETKQDILETLNVKDRMEKVIKCIREELDILKAEKRIGQKVKMKADKNQKEYFLREQIKAIYEELGEDYEQKDVVEYEDKIKKMKMPKSVREKAEYELRRLKSNGASQESSVIKTYLDWILSMPWNKQTKEELDLGNSLEILDQDHYGLEEVKERIIEYLAVKKKSKDLKGPIICLVGPPGVGKTSIARSIAKSLNRNFVRISLGGIHDEAAIRGHRRTYVGALPGRIVSAVKEAKSMNPLFLLDEIDKVSSDYRGNPYDALLEILDGEQNKTFRDNYLEVDLDLSKVMFIATANTLDTIPAPLRDRLEIIEVSGYTYEEKFNIAKKYLLPKQLKENGTSSEEVAVSDNTLKTLIENYTRESGVRELDRKIGTVVRKSVSDIVVNKKKKINVNTSVLTKYIGPSLITYDKVKKTDSVGVVRGLAWTSVGGDTLDVEVMVMNGTGKFELTGQLGDVMKESAKAGYTYVRANSERLGIDPDFYKNKDIHIHVPEGAVPKDGPSAGVTIITALVSALSGKPVKHNVAMTGEITLTGRVLAIGGLKEKSLAAFRAGVDTIIIPKDNEKDIDKLPLSIKKKLKILLAENVNDVLINAIRGVE